MMEEKKQRVTLKKNEILDPQTYEHPSTFGNEDTSMKAFIRNLSISVISSSEDTLVFDIVGIEPPLANALR